MKKQQKIMIINQQLMKKHITKLNLQERMTKQEKEMYIWQKTHQK